MVKQQKPQKPIIQQHAEPVKPVAVPLPVVPQAPAVTENAIMPAKAVMQPVPEAKIEENISQSTQQKAPETSAKQITVDTDNTTKETQKSAVSASYSNETTSSIITGPQFNAAYLNNPAPEYPASAKRRHMQGKVLLNVTVGTNGNALRVNLSKSSGFSLLDTLAKDTVMRWTFIPAKRGEQPMQANVIVPIEFRLE
jgi:periplasmic protein TonB